MKIKRIVLLGPESTGKSTLVRKLADQFETGFVPEYARTFLENNNGKYSLADIVTIAIKQAQLEDERIRHATRYLFCDTDMIYLKVWCEVMFRQCPPEILQLATERVYDYYLLTYPDLAWDDDPVRENPGIRKMLFDEYFKQVRDMSVPYSIIEGTGEERFERCLKALEVFAEKSMEQE